MPAARQHVLKPTFGTGELSVDMSARRDTTQYADGAAMMLNTRLRTTGGFSRRPGTTFLASIGASGRAVNFSDLYILVFKADGSITAYNPDGTTDGTAGSGPWTTDARVNQLDITVSGTSAFVTHEDFPPQVISRSAAGTWSIAGLAWTSGVSSEIKQPYYRFADASITMTPSALTGSITLTVSSAVFVAGHVGARFRYHGREILVTAYTSATQVTGTVQQDLYPSLDITVGSTADFAVGDVIEGDTSGVRGVIRNVSSGTVMQAILLDGYTSFGTTEDIIGPRGKSTASAVSASSSPLAALDWDEQAFSTVRGFPYANTIHASRLWFGGHPLIPDMVLASVINDFTNFDVGVANDADAIFELIGSDPIGTVVGMFSARQLLILTTEGVHYVPQSEANPPRPTSIQFPRLYRVGAGRQGAGLFDDGVVFASRRGTRVHQSVPRAQSSVLDPYTFVEASILSTHLITGVRHVAFNGDPDGIDERYGYFVMEDGSMAVMHSLNEESVRGWVPWTTEGEFQSVAAVDGKVYVTTTREIDATTVYWLEVFDEGATLDGVVEIATPTTAAALYAGHTVRVVTATSDWGEHVADVSGNVTLSPVATGPLDMGLPYTLHVKLLPPEFQLPNGAVAGRRIRIAKARLNILESCAFEIEDLRLHAFPASFTALSAPVAQTGTFDFRFLGWEVDPQLEITQENNLPLTVLGITLEIYAHGD